MHHRHTGFPMPEPSHTFTKLLDESQRKEPILQLSEHKVNSRILQTLNCVTFVHVSLLRRYISPGGP